MDGTRRKFRHRHLSYPPSTPVEKWPIAALLDVLERGDLADWKPIAVAVARDPHGPLAARVLKIVNTHRMYGTSVLWRMWIGQRRARAAGPSAPSELRVGKRAALRRRERKTVRRHRPS